MNRVRLALWKLMDQRWSRAVSTSRFCELVLNSAFWVKPAEADKSNIRKE
jgi:hypothetical protein